MTGTYRQAEDIGRTPQGPRAVPPLGGQPQLASELAHSDVVLDNGLRVLAVRQATVPLVELRLMIPFAGEEKQHSAVAEVLAETLLTGTARRDRVTVDSDLAQIGGELGTVVDPSFLRVNGGALAEHLSTLLDVLADVLTEAAYPDHEVRKEAGRLVERIAVARTQPGVIAREALQHRRYGDHPYTREVPQSDQVAAVTTEAVRNLHAASVLPRGSTLVLVGDIDPDTVVGDVERALRPWSADRAAPQLSALPDIHPRDVLLVNRPGAVQSQIRLSAQSLPRTHPRYPALQLANLTFGGYFSSRLVENIREDKGYTYSAHSGFEFTGAQATVQVEADTASEVTAPALLETRYELGRLGLVPPSDADVEAARQYAIGSLLIAASSQAGLASQLAALAAVGLDMEWLSGHPARIAGVTSEEVARAALDFFAPGRFTGVVVGDADSLAPQLTGLGDVVTDDPDHG